MAQIRIECDVSTSLLSDIDDAAIERDERRGPCIRFLCKLALRYPDHPPKSYDVNKTGRCGARFGKEFLDNAKDYRKKHNLLTHRAFLLDALPRGIAIYESKLHQG